MTSLRWTLVFSIALVARPAFGQDVASGPEKGKTVPSLKVFDATGPHKDKDVDYTAERKGKPTIYLLVNAAKFDRPMAKFMKGLDEAVPEAHKDASLVAVWVTADADKTKEYLPRAQQSLKFEATPLTCYTGGEAGPKDWNVNSDAHITIVVANKGKVAAVFGYLSVNDTEVCSIVGALKKAVE